MSSIFDKSEKNPYVFELKT